MFEQLGHCQVLKIIHYGGGNTISPLNPKVFGGKTMGG